jgi:hypothetical protein
MRKITERTTTLQEVKTLQFPFFSFYSSKHKPCRMAHALGILFLIFRKLLKDVHFNHTSRIPLEKFW